MGYLFQIFFSNANVRFTFWMSALLSSLASVGDYVIVRRWNIDWGISDKAFYLIGDTILEPMVGMMAAMPSVVLMSKMCPENMEASMFAILASFNNLGSSLSSALGVFAMDFVGIHTDLSDAGACDFSGLPSLTFYCGKYTERMQEHPTKSSDMVSFVWMCITLGSIFATLCSFFSIKYENYRSLMWVGAPLSAQAVFTSLAGWLPEKKVQPRDESGGDAAERGDRKAGSFFEGKLWKENYKVFLMSVFMAVMW